MHTCTHERLHTPLSCYFENTTAPLNTHPISHLPPPLDPRPQTAQSTFGEYTRRYLEIPSRVNVPGKFLSISRESLDPTLPRSHHARSPAFSPPRPPSSRFLLRTLPPCSSDGSSERTPTTEAQTRALRT